MVSTQKTRLDEVTWALRRELSFVMFNGSVYVAGVQAFGKTGGSNGFVNIALMLELPYL
jgi:hypothetical protein